MNVSELITLVNYRRREDTETFITEDEILSYLKEGNRAVGANYQYEWSKVSTTFTYTDGSIRYALSSVAGDLDEPIDMFYSDDYYFTQTSPENFMRLSAYSADMFAIDGDYMLVNTSFGDGTITFNYYTDYLAKTSGGSLQENLATNQDEPTLPENHQDILVDFASARCYQKESMYDDYKIAYQDFLVKLRKLQIKKPSRKKHQSKTWQSPRRIRHTGVADKTDPLNQIL